MEDFEKQVKKYLFLFTAIAVLGGNSGTLYGVLYPERVQPIVRAGPFSKTDAEQMRVAVLREVAANSAYCEALDEELDEHLHYTNGKFNRLDVILERHKIRIDDCLKRLAP